MSILESPKIYILILNYQTWQDTIECLESILKLNYDNYQVIVVDNNSPNSSMQFLLNWAKGRIPVELEDNNSLKPLSYPNVSKPIKFSYYLSQDIINSKLEYSDSNDIVFIQSDSNKGYSAGNNIGLKYALVKNDFDFIWILNNDVVVSQDSLSLLVKNFEIKKQKIGLCGTKVKFYYTPNIIQSLGGTYNKYLGFSTQIGIYRKDTDSIKNKSIDYVNGCSVFVTKPFIETVGLMNEDYFLYFEEIDWATRASKYGFTIDYCYDSVIYHKDGASTKETKKSNLASPFSDYHFTKSKIIFTKKYYSTYLPLIYFSFLIVILNRIRRRQFENIKYILRAIFIVKN